MTQKISIDYYIAKLKKVVKLYPIVKTNNYFVIIGHNFLQ